MTDEQLSRDAALLILEGLDTYADIYLNGSLLERTDNMFVGYTLPVKEVLRKGENHLQILFHSPVKQTLPQWETNGFDYPADNDHSDKRVSIYSRKAPYSYGWDWGIRLVTSGIWRPVTLTFYDVALLGADDKAGIAEIIQAMVYLREHPEIKHGRIRVGFNPDEEIGMGAHLFDVEKFGCEWAYTMDGGEVGELEFENFNAAAAKVTVRGLNVHPGYAKGKMRNSMLVAAEFIRRMPSDETPQTTEGYEGFYHLTGMKGTVEETVLSYIIRDHDRQKFENRKAFVRQLAEELNAENGEGTVTVEVRDQYYNMREKVEPVMYIIDIAKKAIEASGVECRVKAIRGGTDGAQLSFKGLPCPNIFAGGLNFHGRHEFVPVQSMEKAMMTIVKIAELTALR